MHKKVVIATIVCSINIITLCMENHPQSMLDFFLPTDPSETKSTLPAKLVDLCVKSTLDNQPWWYCTEKWRHRYHDIVDVQFAHNGETLVYAINSRFQDKSHFYRKNTDNPHSNTNTETTFPSRIRSMRIDQSGKKYALLFKNGFIDYSENRPAINSSRESCVALSSDGSLIAYEGMSQPRTIKVFNLNTHKGTPSVALYDHFIIDVIRFSADNSKLAISNAHGTLMVKDLNEKTAITFTFNDDSVGTVLLFNNDNTHLYCAVSDKTIRTFDLANNVEIDSFTCEETPWNLFFNDNNELIAWYVITDENDVSCLKTVNINTGIITPIFSYDSILHSVSCIDISPRQQEFALDADGAVILFKRYNNPTSQQILLRSILRLWSQVKRPHKSIKTVHLLLRSIVNLFKIEAQFKLDVQALTETWYSFPQYMQDALWRNVRRIIAKYGKQY